MQNKNIRTAAIAVICALIIVAIVIALVVFSRQDDDIEEPKVATVPATVRADHAPALSVKLDRGDLVYILDEKDDYYLVEYYGEKDTSATYANASADGSANGGAGADDISDADDGANADSVANADDSANANIDAHPADSADASILETENNARISKQGAAILYIDKKYVRKAEQSAPTQWTGYIQSPAALFSTAMLTGSSIAELEQNTEVTVLDAFADCLFIELSDKTRGYIAAKAVGNAPVEESAEYEPGWDDGANYTYYSPQYYDGGGGSQTGGWQGGDIDLGGEATGSDGGDIVLSDPDPAVANYMNFANFANAGALCVPFIAQAYADELPDEPSDEAIVVHAIVLSDGIQTYLDWFDRGATIDVVDTSCLSEEDASLIPEGKSVVVIEDQWGIIDNNLIKLEGDEDYEPWEGFTASGAGLFSAYTLQGEPSILEINQKVTVIDDLSTCYVVMFGEQLGYMAKSEVSATLFEEPEEEEIIDYGGDYSYYGGGYYDYGYDASSPPVDAGNTESSDVVIENTIGGWTDEKL